MKMFNREKKSYPEKGMGKAEKSMNGYYGGEHRSPSHKPIKGTPMPGHATSTMEKEIGATNKNEPGEKKYKSNTMSPGCKEGKINDYGK